jgi:alginate O-acetyltransferase complex protein AlgI
VDFAVFVAYFPHLVAGPILRATRAAAADRAPRRITREQMRDGLWLIAWGFFQKIFVADNLAPLASHVFDPGAHPTGVNVLLGTYAFAFQIYGDFAGYSNIARGTSKLMGIELIENFRFPYLVARRRNSGATGTSACRPGCAIICTSRSAAAAARRGSTQRNLF